MCNRPDSVDQIERVGGGGGGGGGGGSNLFALILQSVTQCTIWRLSFVYEPANSIWTCTTDKIVMIMFDDLFGLIFALHPW